MKKSKWAIVARPTCGSFYWSIFCRSRPSIMFSGYEIYTRRDSAIRGAKRMAKRLRINAEVE